MLKKECFWAFVVQPNKIIQHIKNFAFVVCIGWKTFFSFEFAILFLLFHFGFILLAHSTLIKLKNECMNQQNVRRNRKFVVCEFGLCMCESEFGFFCCGPKAIIVWHDCCRSKFSPSFRVYFDWSYKDWYLLSVYSSEIKSSGFVAVDPFFPILKFMVLRWILHRSAFE